MATNSPKDSKPAPQAPPKRAPGEDTQNAGPEEGSPAPKKRRYLKILLVLLPFMGVAAGGAWYLLQEREQATDTKAGAAKGTPAKAASSRLPAFVPLEAFTVNLQHDDAGSQYLQVGLALKVADAGAVDAIKLRMPEIRNRVLLLLSGKKASEITTSEGKTALSTELTREVNLVLAGGAPSQSIDSVLFTSFVIQ